MTFTPQSSCLLLIDLQARLMPAIADSVRLLDTARRLAETARLLDIPIYATEQNRSGLGETVGALRSFALSTFQKMHFDATRERAWMSFLPNDRDDIVVCGTETHVCVLQTVRGLLAQGRRVQVVRDAVGSRSADDRQAGLHSMERHGAELVTSEMVAFGWLQTCDHPRFRDVLKIVKKVGREGQDNELQSTRVP